MSLVFQKPLLFPHLTVEQNVAFGLRIRGARRARRPRAAVARDARAGPPGRAGRSPGRRALRRAGAAGRAGPGAGAASRGCCCSTSRSRSSTPTCAPRCAAWCATCTTRRGLTTLFVTHDQDEAVELADTGRADARRAARPGPAPPRPSTSGPPSLARPASSGWATSCAGVVARRRLPHRPGGARGGARPRPPTGPRCSSCGPRRSASTVTCPRRSPRTRFAGTDVVVDTTLPDGQALRVRVPLGTRVAVGDRLALGSGRSGAPSSPRPTPTLRGAPVTRSTYVKARRLRRAHRRGGRRPAGRSACPTRERAAAPCSTASVPVAVPAFIALYVGRLAAAGRAERGADDRRRGAAGLRGRARRGAGRPRSSAPVVAFGIGRVLGREAVQGSAASGCATSTPGSATTASRRCCWPGWCR